MTIIQLQYVISVAEYRNFTVAADKSFVTQPTLSMQIQKLEKELEIELFDRSTHPITITPMGKKVIEQAKKILAEAKQMKNMVLEEKNSTSGTLTVGIIPTIFPTLVPLFYKTFKKNFPKTQLIVKELKTEEIIEKFQEGTLDFAIAATPLDEPKIIEEPIYYEPLVGFIPKEHHLYKTDKIKVDDIKNNEVLLLAEGHCFRNNVLSVCSAAQTQITDIQSGDFNTLIKLCKEGLGMTVLPLLHSEELNDEDKKSIKYFDLKNTPTREVSLLYHETQLRMQFKNEFVQLIQGIIRGKLFLESSSVTSPKIKFNK